MRGWDPEETEPGGHQEGSQAQNTIEKNNQNRFLADSGLKDSGLGIIQSLEAEMRVLGHGMPVNLVPYSDQSFTQNGIPRLIMRHLVLRASLSSGEYT